MRIYLSMEDGNRSFETEHQFSTISSENELHEIIRRLTVETWSSLTENRGILLQAVPRSNWIKAIKIIRDHSDMGLKETKDFVERVIDGVPSAFLVNLKNRDVITCVEQLNKIDCKAVPCTKDEYDVCELMGS
jgi:ribosomal protein L7/L12